MSCVCMCTPVPCLLQWPLHCPSLVTGEWGEVWWWGDGQTRCMAEDGEPHPQLKTCCLTSSASQIPRTGGSSSENFHF